MNVRVFSPATSKPRSSSWKRCSSGVPRREARRAALGHYVLRDLVGEHVQMISDALGVLRFLEMSRGARAELKTGREALQAQHVFQREERTRLGVVDHGDPGITFGVSV